MKIKLSLVAAKTRVTLLESINILKLELLGDIRRWNETGSDIAENNVNSYESVWCDVLW